MAGDGSLNHGDAQSHEALTVISSSIAPASFSFVSCTEAFEEAGQRVAALDQEPAVPGAAHGPDTAEGVSDASGA